MTIKFVAKSLKLTPEQWAQLDRLADEMNTAAPTGTRAGQPSWRSLIKAIADGAIVLKEQA